MVLCAINILGCASISRALSGHIDKPFGYPMRNFFQQTFPMNVSFLAPYPDLFSFTSILALTSKYTTKEQSNLKIQLLIMDIVQKCF